jgi:hypothetical protein
MTNAGIYRRRHRVSAILRSRGSKESVKGVIEGELVSAHHIPWSKLPLNCVGQLCCRFASEPVSIVNVVQVPNHFGFLHFHRAPDSANNHHRYAPSARANGFPGSIPPCVNHRVLRHPTLSACHPGGRECSSSTVTLSNVSPCNTITGIKIDVPASTRVIQTIRGMFQPAGGIPHRSLTKPLQPAAPYPAAMD